MWQNQHPKIEHILPRWFPTVGDGKQQVWSSDRKVLGLEKRYKDSSTIRFLSSHLIQPGRQ